jgi:hypothetical protein
VYEKKLYLSLMTNKAPKIANIVDANTAKTSILPNLGRKALNNLLAFYQVFFM